MPLTQEGNYLHEEDGFICNHCKEFYPNCEQCISNKGEAICKGCNDLEYDNFLANGD